jgi:hypothetical protein
LSIAVIFDVTDQVEQAMQRQAFQRDGLIGLDAYPYRALKRGKQCMAVFVERTADLVMIVALGRVMPGDLSGKSYRILEFDLCDMVTPGVPVTPNTDMYSDITHALRNRTTLTPLKSDKLLALISQSSKHAAYIVKQLRSHMEPNRVDGETGFLLACEQDAIALSLKAANLHTQLSKLSTWTADSPCPPLISGLKEAREPDDFWSCPENEVLLPARNGTRVFGWMRMARDEDGYGLGVTLVDVRPIGNSEPSGVDLVYFHPRFGALALLHYSSDRSFPEYVDDVDRLYAGEDNLTDPRLVPRPGFVKFTTKRHFEATKERLLNGTIHAAMDLRDWKCRRDGQFNSQRHLSNSTFAALLGGGWLGGARLTTRRSARSSNCRFRPIGSS